MNSRLVDELGFEIEHELVIAAAFLIQACYSKHVLGVSTQDDSLKPIQQLQQIERST